MSSSGKPLGLSRAASAARVTDLEDPRGSKAKSRGGATLGVVDDGGEREDSPGAVRQASQLNPPGLKRTLSLTWSKKKIDKAKAGVALSYEPKSHALTEALLQRADSKTRSRVEQAAKSKQSDTGAGAGSPDLVLVEKVLKTPPEDRTEEECIRLQSELSKARVLGGLQLSPDAELQLCKVANIESHRQREQVVYRAGEVGEKFYIVLSGVLNVEKRGKDILAVMRQGALFGEPALLYNKPRSNTVWVEESCKLMVISNKDYKLRLGPLHALDAQIKFREFRLMSAFEQWSDEMVADMVEHTTLRRYMVGETLFKEGQTCEWLMFVVKGFVRVTRDLPKGPGDAPGAAIEWAVLSSGSTLDIKATNNLAPARYSAIASSIVEVMALAAKGKLLDMETVERLHGREPEPPHGDELRKYAENKTRWKEYKKQLVSGVVWEMRAKRANPSGTGATFGRFCNLPTRNLSGHGGGRDRDKGGDDDDEDEEAEGRGWLIHSLTDGIANAVLPSVVKDPHARKANRNITDNSILGKFLLPPEDIEFTLSRGQKAIDEFAQQAEKIYTMAGIIEPVPHFVRNKWIKAAREKEARIQAELAKNKGRGMSGYMRQLQERNAEEQPASRDTAKSKGPKGGSRRSSSRAGTPLLDASGGGGGGGPGGGGGLFQGGGCRQAEGLPWHEMMSTVRASTAFVAAVPAAGTPCASPGQRARAAGPNARRQRRGCAHLSEQRGAVVTATMRHFLVRAAASRVRTTPAGGQAVLASRVHSAGGAAGGGLATHSAIAMRGGRVC